MRKYLISFTISGFLLSTLLTAQTRYLDEVFTEVIVTSDIKYAENYSYNGANPPVLTDLYLDLYEPKNDTLSSRPVIILAHGGSFLEKCTQNTLPHGDKEDLALVEMCELLAKKGFVAISMGYRLGWNPLSADLDERIQTSQLAVYRGMQDMKACIRYAKLNSFLYGLDTNNIVIGGSETGAMIAMYCHALDDTLEISGLDLRHSSTGLLYIDWNIWGDLEGKNGDTCCSKYNNAGPSSKSHLTFTMGGSIWDTNWIEAGDNPIIAFHGVQNALSAFKKAGVIIAPPWPNPLDIFGSYNYMNRSNNLGNQNLHDKYFNDKFSEEAKKKVDYLPGLFPFEGIANGYEPYAWYDTNSACIDTMCTGQGSAANPCASKSKALFYIDTIIGYGTKRIVQVLELPGNTVGIDLPTLDRQVSVYPNPVLDELTIDGLKDEKFYYQINDNMGRMLKQSWSEYNQIDLSNLVQGLFHLYIQEQNGGNYYFRIVK